MQRIADRLSEPDTQQYLVLYLAALLFALFASWPGSLNEPNDTWYSLAYTRAAALSLLGLGYGITVAGAGVAQQRLTASMLVGFSLLGLPLEIPAFAASYPDTPLAWVLILPPLTALAMFGLGLPLGHALAAIRLKALAPVLIPALLVGLVMLDVQLGFTLLNPFTAAVRVTWPHLALLLLACCGLFFVWYRAGRRAAE